MTMPRRVASSISVMASVSVAQRIAGGSRNRDRGSRPAAWRSACGSARGAAATRIPRCEREPGAARAASSPGAAEMREGDRVREGREPEPAVAHLDQPLGPPPRRRPRRRCRARDGAASRSACARAARRGPFRSRRKRTRGSSRTVRETTTPSTWPALTTWARTSHSSCLRVAVVSARSRPASARASPSPITNSPRKAVDELRVAHRHDEADEAGLAGLERAPGSVRHVARRGCGLAHALARWGGGDVGIAGESARETVRDRQAERAREFLQPWLPAFHRPIPPPGAGHPKTFRIRGRREMALLASSSGGASPKRFGQSYCQPERPSSAKLPGAPRGARKHAARRGRAVR